MKTYFDFRGRRMRFRVIGSGFAAELQNLKSDDT